MSDHKRVIVESPYAGDIEANVTYARRCMRDSLLRREAPILSHLLYTQPGVLRDEVPEERSHGIDAGLSWGCVAEKTAIYVDRGISGGMKYGIANAKTANRQVVIRSFSEDPESPHFIGNPDALALEIANTVEVDALLGVV